MTHSTNHRTDHTYWEHLAPYYVNRTLAPSDRIAFERHLAACPACRHALEGWHTVAGVVQREVAGWAKQAPPLSSEARAQIGPIASPVSYDLRREDRHSARVTRRRIQMPLTLVAAAVMIVLFGALLIAMAATRHEPTPASEGEANNIWPTLGLRTTHTPLPTLPPSDLGILGNDSLAVPQALDTFTPQALEAFGMGGASSTVCQAAPAGNNAVPLYGSPGGGEIAGYLAPGEWLDVFQRTTEDWYQLIGTNGYLAGWVRGSAIKLDGSCQDVLYPTPTWIPAPVTSTAVFQGSIGMGYLLVTTEQVGMIPANTRVRISHAWLDNGSWLYSVVTEDETRQADARTWQLTYAPDVTPGPTPTNVFQMLVGNGDYRFVTREPIGLIPPYTAVRIDAAWFNGVEWTYTIVSQSGLTGAARLSQIQYPPPEFFATMTATAQSVTPTVTPTQTAQSPGRSR